MNDQENKNQNGPMDTLLHENRKFEPSQYFRNHATITDNELYEKAALDREQFWAECADELQWSQKWDRVLEWNPPFAQWFVGGRINASVNCLDRHIDNGLERKSALLWEGENGDTKNLTYGDLFLEVNRIANCLKILDIKKGDRVAIYMPLTPDAVAAMLACARIGAIHTVVFAGFSAHSLKERIQDADAKLLITADGGYRKGKITPLKKTADEALSECPSIRKVLLFKRTNEEVPVQKGRDYWYHDLKLLADNYCPPEAMESEDLLYILYTSGTTGKPKGIVHSTGGYLVGVQSSMKWVFDCKPGDVYWCTADIGWVTGHSYVVYGPLCCGLTQIIYEGSPDFPEKDRFWQIIQKYGVTIFYTAPTAIRTFMKWGTEWPKRRDLSSLRLLGTVGEPINPEAWLWYYQNIGSEKCPIVDTWWQTETGSILIAPIPGITTLKPGSATFPLPGIETEILNERGKPSEAGYLAITSPWPSMLRGIYRDPGRFKETYWKKWNGSYYFTGDGAKKDEEGYFWLLGRVDDVMNVSGHRIGTMEVESVLVEHEGVAEAAVVGVTDEITGQAITAFVTLKEGTAETEAMAEDLKKHIVDKIGALARPKRIIFARDLPKTRSGKIMRRLLRDLIEKRILGDVTTLADPAVIEDLKVAYEED